MQTTDTSNLFQSDAQHARASFRAAKSLLYAEAGDPIKLGSKPLRVVIKQQNGKEADAWCAESGFLIRRVGLDSGKTKQVYRGHLGPVTSLDFYTTGAIEGSNSRTLLISGSWDKSFKVWDTQTKAVLSTTLAHIDFIKALVVIPSLDILVTGSSDKDLRIWDLKILSTDTYLPTETTTSEQVVEEVEYNQASTFLPDIPIPTGAAPPAPKSLLPLPLLLSLKSHTRPIERLAFYHLTSENEQGESIRNGRIALLSADSLGALKTWEIWREEDGSLKGELKSEIRPHEIGIYDLIVGDGEIWTASADNSILVSTFSSSTPLIPPQPTLRIPHPSGVKSLLSLSLSLPSLNSNYLLTGSVDESIRIFNLDELDTSSTLGGGGGMVGGKPWLGIPLEEGSEMTGMVKEVTGHSHDVIELGCYIKYVESEKEGEGKKSEAWILSASIDGTLRRWQWPNCLVEEVKIKVEVPTEEKDKGMTEEEERELEELMDGLDDQ